MPSLSDIRQEYTAAGLTETELDPNPFAQFAQWFRQAVESEVPEPTGMTLATVNDAGQPSVRVVLLKGFDEQGFVFFTNYEGKKAGDLAANPHAGINFWWSQLQRQVRIEGTVEKVADAESDEYFASRPLGSRIGAWASEQSRVISGREELEARVHEIEARFADGKIPRPPFWGGYRLRPTMIEFWQGRPSRLHDRLRYRLLEGEWAIERLSP
ncbi:MAG: pyridoxamine 5'-phosphate oxidase [Armatimonadetes bacterium]|nr:pyridoxamine 5'-phosphate oxidase [Armatimonadota bacterium]